MIRMPEFLQHIAQQVIVYQQALQSGDDTLKLVQEWKSWVGQAKEKLPNMVVSEEHATACIGELSPGCQACKEGAWDCIFLTMRCNLRCSFCCSPISLQQEEAGSAFGLSTYMIAENYRKSNIKGISFSGGEILTVLDRLLEWVSAFRSYFPNNYLWIYTNGVLGNRHTFEKLAHLGINEIRFNAAAAGYTNTHLLDNIRIAANLFERVTVEIPAIPEDRSRLIDALPLWAEAGVQHLNLHQLMLEPGTLSENYLGSRQGYYLSDGHFTEICQNSSQVVLDVMSSTQKKQIPLGVNYCSLLNKVRQVKSRRQSLLPITRMEYEAIIPGHSFNSTKLTCYVFYESPHQYFFCHPDNFDSTRTKFPQCDWVQITRFAPLAYNDRGGWIEFLPGKDTG